MIIWSWRITLCCALGFALIAAFASPLFSNFVYLVAGLIAGLLAMTFSARRKTVSAQDATQGRAVRIIIRIIIFLAITSLTLIVFHLSFTMVRSQRETCVNKLIENLGVEFKKYHDKHKTYPTELSFAEVNLHCSQIWPAELHFGEITRDSFSVVKFDGEHSYFYRSNEKIWVRQK